jgi:hypothetical protein
VKPYALDRAAELVFNGSREDGGNWSYQGRNETSNNYDSTPPFTVFDPLFSYLVVMRFAGSRTLHLALIGLATQPRLPQSQPSRSRVYQGFGFLIDGAFPTNGPSLVESPLK